MNKYAVWFRRTVWAGIVANFLLAVPAIFVPEKMLDLLGLRQTADPVWTSFAALLLLLLSAFYIPGANDPYRYRFNAWLAVLARAAGVIFFFTLAVDFYPAFGFFDGFFFVIQLPLLILTMRAEPAADVAQA